MISETMQKRQLISRRRESLLLVFLGGGVKKSLESALFVIFCCHFLNFQHSGWNPTLRTPIYSDSFICSNQSDQHLSQTSNDPPPGECLRKMTSGALSLISLLSTVLQCTVNSPLIRTFKGNRKTFELSMAKLYGK